jgi:hypothetical protein
MKKAAGARTVASGGQGEKMKQIVKDSVVTLSY